MRQSRFSDEKIVSILREAHSFLSRAYHAPIDCFVITVLEPRFLPRTPLPSDNRIPALVERARFCDDHPCCSGDLGCERDGDFVHMHPGL